MLLGEAIVTTNLSFESSPWQSIVDPLVETSQLDKLLQHDKVGLIEGKWMHVLRQTFITEFKTNFMYPPKQHLYGKCFLMFNFKSNEKRKICNFLFLSPGIILNLKVEI